MHSSFFFIVSLVLLVSSSTATPNKQKKNESLQTYIVHVSQPENLTILTSFEERISYHKSFLPSSSLSSEDGHDRILYSYRHAISGFAARLSEEEIEAMEEKPGFLSAQPDGVVRLRTTYTPYFLGLQPSKGLWKHSNFGKGVVIGVMDSGALLEHPSFGDKWMPPPPAKWKGQCNFKGCNKKVIGARVFTRGLDVVLGRNGDAKATIDDKAVHGTHTAATAAGAFVYIPQLFNGNGTATGLAPLAHLAIYKVCDADQDPSCAESDILKGIDSAIEDGVDVISLSLAGDIPNPHFYDSSIDLGTFRAMQKGIFSSACASNEGPGYYTVKNNAPWYLTVGASSTDRRFEATVMLGDGEVFHGESLFQPKDFNSDFLPLIFPGANGDVDAKNCNGSFGNTDIMGKIVFCEADDVAQNSMRSDNVRKAGGVGMITMNPKEYGHTIIVDEDRFVLPASHVSYDDGLKIKAYIKSSKSPRVKIALKGIVFGQRPTPMVASFSSRGPNLPSPGILKPDIIGPGVNILAASPVHTQDSIFSFIILTGTSMSTPHLSGIAALLKSSHPDWSPAAIQSALMTTAYVIDHQGKPIVEQRHVKADVFAIGSGHVDPARANDPGLIYDREVDDYVGYLCGLGYTNQQVERFTLRKNSCDGLKSIKEGDLNYPSFSVILGPTQTYRRTVTNVGEARSKYNVYVDNPQGVQVIVKPSELYFTHVGEKKTFMVTFSRSNNGLRGYTEGYLKWVSSSHEYVVRSPISVNLTTKL